MALSDLSVGEVVMLCRFNRIRYVKIVQVCEPEYEGPFMTAFNKVIVKGGLFGRLQIVDRYHIHKILEPNLKP